MRRAAFAILTDDEGRSVFVKLHGSEMELAYHKGRQLYDISLNSGSFRAPEPLQKFADQGLIVWEHIPGLVHLREYLLRTRREKRPDWPELHEKVIRKCGRTLGEIHSALDFGDQRRRQAFELTITAQLSRLHQAATGNINEAPERFLHGDFGCANIYVPIDPDIEPDVVVLDATPNLYMYQSQEPDAFGSPYLDLALFVSSLYSKGPFYFRFRGYLEKYTKVFVEGYECGAACSIDQATLIASAAETISRYGDYQRGRAAMGAINTLAEWRFRKWIAYRLIRSADRPGG